MRKKRAREVKKETLTFQLVPEFVSLLEELALKRGTTKVAILKKAVALYNFVDEEVLDKDDHHLVILNKEGETITKLLLSPF